MGKNSNKVRTRFAPSPTGSMHIGNLRTAFYAYVLAKHYKGDFILRIEDTDKKREAKGGVQEIKKLLKIFDVKWDEFYIQSERLDYYKKAAEKLVDDGHAFYCQCESKNAKNKGYSKELRDSCRDKKYDKGAIKLKVPENENISFKDFVLDEVVKWNTDVVFDATLLKSDGYPTYHLAVVVDDHEMKVSHVLRGHDWLPSTPIHLLLYEYLNYQVPQIGHLTDILDPDGGKLSKRKGSISVSGMLSDGYLPEALFNFVILSGWAPKDNRELYSLSDFVEEFDEKGFQKSNPVFNREKLDWFNSQYIMKLSDDELSAKILEFYKKKYDQSLLRKVVPLIKSRIKTFKEFAGLAGFFFEKPKVDEKLFKDGYKDHLKSALDVIEIQKDWKLDKLNDALMKEIKGNNYKVGDFFMSLRIAVTGSKFTPPINDSIIILGKDETIKRLKAI